MVRMSSKSVLWGGEARMARMARMASKSALKGGEARMVKMGQYGEDSKQVSIIGWRGEDGE